MIEKKLVVLGLGASVGALVFACSSSDAGSSGTGAGSAGVVEGPADTHCGTKKQVVTQAACTGGGGEEADAGAHDDSDAGEEADGGHDHGDDADGGADLGLDDEYGDTMYGSEGDDDECKYHIKWSATSIAENQDVTFTVQLTTKTDDKPVTGGQIYIEATLGDTHPPKKTPPPGSESSTPGTYTIAGVQFDQAGKWDVRFHINGQCEDGEESPHGHGAFFVQVP